MPTTAAAGDTGTGAERGGGTVSPFSLPGPALLFCPGHRPALFSKAADRADCVVIDLEDAVPADERDAARAAITHHRLDPDRTIVRVNAVGTRDHDADLEALRGTEYRTIMLAKAETADQVIGLADLSVIALCETPLGVLNAASLAAARNVIGLMWGSEDLMACLGAASARHRDGRLRAVATHARNQVLMAAKAFGQLAVDTVFPDYSDADGLVRETEDAAANGFDGKACIHPGQVDVVRTAFRPTEQQLAWALRVMGAVDTDGVTSVDGQMVDQPVVRQARSILEREPRKPPLA